jgi:DNA gyrase/topoisomerase IV subunit A
MTVGMPERQEIIDALAKLAGEASTSLTNEALIDADPVLFRRARKVFGTWEDAVVAALCYTARGKKRRPSRAEVVAEEHHLRQPQDGWDGLFCVATDDGLIFSVRGNTVPTEHSIPAIPQPFAPKGHPQRILGAMSNPDEKTVVLLSDQGLAYPLNGRVIPEATLPDRTVGDVTGMASSDAVASMIPRGDLQGGKRFVHTTTGGKTKASSVHEFGRNLDSGTVAFLLSQDDAVCSTFVEGRDHTGVFCASSGGNGIHYANADVRSMGLRAQGVKAMALGDFEALVGAEPVTGEEQVVVLTMQGFGKRVSLREFRPQGRGGQGMILMRPHEDGDEIALIAVIRELDSDVFIWTSEGNAVRLAATAVPLLGRSQKGVAVLQLDSGERVEGSCVLPGSGPA